MVIRADFIDWIAIAIIIFLFISAYRIGKHVVVIIDIIDNKDRPLDQVILCPYCFTRHIDDSDPDIGWTNPPHKTHLCRQADGGCGKTFRPSVFYTNGV